MRKLRKWKWKSLLPIHILPSHQISKEIMRELSQQKFGGGIKPYAMLSRTNPGPVVKDREK